MSCVVRRQAQKCQEVSDALLVANSDLSLRTVSQQIHTQYLTITYMQGTQKSCYQFRWQKSGKVMFTGDILALFTVSSDS